MAQFIIGFVVGLVVTELVMLMMLGLCRAAANGEEQGELERLEKEQQDKHKIIGNL
jgi:hypothetical protein